MKPVILRPGIGDNRPTATLYYGRDTRESLRALPEASIHTVCTSPPYWGLRDYGVDGQIGLENTPEEFVIALVEVFREAKRVLRPDGTLWVNLGDSYWGGKGASSFGMVQEAGDRGVIAKPHQNAVGGRGKTRPQDGNHNIIKPKDLVGIPWRVAFALQADGWYLRSAIPWAKRNCMPSSQTDRPTTGVEYVFLFSHPDSGGRYFYDMDATRVAPNTKPQRRLAARREHSKGGEAAPGAEVRPPNYETSAEPTVACTPINGRNRRDTDWFFESLDHVVSGGQGLLSSEDGSPLAFVVNPKPYKGSHFAVWPPDLVRPMILSGTSAQGVCSKCGAPWNRILIQAPVDAKDVSVGGYPARKDNGSRVVDPSGRGGNVLATKRLGSDNWQPTCDCVDAQTIPATVLDPFSGSATTGMVALQEGRNYIGLDLNPDYLPLAEARVQDMPAPETETGESDSSGDIFDLFGGGT